MRMPPRLRKAVLTVHVVTSVGWLGALLAYLALDVTAVTSQDAELVRGAYVGMNVTVFAVIVPLAVASILIGTVNALGTPWGLFRHYWVVIKLLLTLFATTVLLIQTRNVSDLADMAARSDVDPRTLPGTLAHSVGGAVVLLVTTVLSVFKPQGLTRYGWRKQQRERRGQPEHRTEPSRQSAAT